MSKPSTHRLVSCLMIAGGVALCGCATQSTPPTQTGGNYPPVTPEQLRRAEFSHRTGGADISFSWSFDRDTFAIEGSDIPPDLATALLGPNTSASRIEGTWQIHDGTIEFLVTTGDADDVQRKCSLPIYFTGVIRIETPAAQYVF